MTVNTMKFVKIQCATTPAACVTNSSARAQDLPSSGPMPCRHLRTRGGARLSSWFSASNKVASRFGRQARLGVRHALCVVRACGHTQIPFCFFWKHSPENAF